MAPPAIGRVHSGNARHFLDIPLANGLTTTSSSSTTTTTATPRSLAAAAVPPLPLPTTREESTRVQLQQQRLRDQHHHAVVVSQRIPGFKTSAAFFASLRTNLRLNASLSSSPLSTPPSMRASTGSLPPPSPLSFITDSAMDLSDTPAPEDPMAGVPELKTYPAETEEEKGLALQLVADGVADMRPIANSALFYHPLNMVVFVAVLVVIIRYVLYEQKREPLIAATTCTGATLVVFVLCRWLTQPYHEAAHRIDLTWLGSSEVLVTKFGDEVIGTVIIDWVSSESRQKRKKPQRGEIRGWAVRLKYRKIGVGTALLEAAVAESQKKGAETIEFAQDHANATRVLPSLYNRTFDQTDAKARELLQDLQTSSPARSKKR